MTPERFKRVQSVLAKRQPDLTVLMDEVNKPHNFAAIMRTCDAIGVGDVHAVTPTKRTRFGHATAAGSTRWVDCHRHDDVTVAAGRLKAQGYQLLCTQLSERSVDFRSVDYTKPTCIIVGAEKFGVSEAAAAIADQHVIIPMDGMVQSLNVSVATAIVLYEAERQRRNAGYYDQRRLSEADYQRLLVEWLHPRVAQYCRLHQIAYPAINADTGELLSNPGEVDIELAPEDGEY